MTDNSTQFIYRDIITKRVNFPISINRPAKKLNLAKCKSILNKANQHRNRHKQFSSILNLPLADTAIYMMCMIKTALDKETPHCRIINNLLRSIRQCIFVKRATTN